MLHLVLCEPEVPQNIGNMMRTCMATDTRPHLIQPLDLSPDEQHPRGAGMGYMKELEYTIYKSWKEFTQQSPSDNYHYTTRHDKKIPSQFDFTEYGGNIYFILGKESIRIPKTILSRQLEHCMCLPMMASTRSLNLSDYAAIILRETLRQLDYPGFSGVEVIKGEDWLAT